MHGRPPYLFLVVVDLTVGDVRLYRPIKSTRQLEIIDNTFRLSCNNGIVLPLP